MEESGPEPRDEEDRRTSRPTRRGHRRLKTPPKPPHARRNPAKVEEAPTSATPEGRGGRRRAPDWLSSTLAEDRDVPERGERSKSQEELPVCAPSSACLEREGEASAQSSSDESVEERQRLPRRREELSEEGDLPLERLKHVCRSHHQTTDCDARESGIPPDAAGHQTRQEQQREQQAKTPAPAGVTVAAQKVAAPAAVEAGHAIPPDAAAEAVTPAKTPGAPREEEPDKLMKNLASSCKKQTGERQWTPLQNRRDARRCSRPQEAERQTPPHPPGAHVWPAVLLPRPASGQEKQAIARLTASDHASDSGERAIANDRAAPSDRQGNAHAHSGSGSGQKTATAHAESGHGVTDIDPRIETRHDATENFHAESGSGQKTATAHSMSVHEKSVKRTTTASHAHDRLTANGKRSESDVHES